MSLVPKEAQKHRMFMVGRDHWWGHAHNELPVPSYVTKHNYSLH